VKTHINYTMVGFFVLILTSGLVYGLYWFTSDRDEQSYLDYTIYMPESVSGLMDQAPVKYNGVEVGYVAHIRLNHDNLQQVRLHVKILQSVPITDKTYAMMMSRGITGIAYIGLATESPIGAPLSKLPNEPFPIITAKPSLLVELDRALGEVTTYFAAISKSIQQLLHTDNQESIRSILANFSQITQAVDTQQFTALVEHGIKMSKHISEATEPLPEVLDMLQQTVTTIQQMSVQISAAAEQFNKTTASGQLMIENVNNHLLPEGLNVLVNLNKLLVSIDQVVADVSANPAILLRGKTQLGNPL